MEGAYALFLLHLGEVLSHVSDLDFSSAVCGEDARLERPWFVGGCCCVEVTPTVERWSALTTGCPPRAVTAQVPW